ncbi:hypothetical protein [Streptomyces sp. NPDC050804]|uniref:hypothetical protein n=1 Tax=Streptomyces sp. NPDC050804 TaxID=3154745 RepID=UPI0034443259
MRTDAGVRGVRSGAARPRAMVLDEVWRELAGVGPLSGPQGGPLSRTVKLVLDPLVIRPVLHPQCAGPLVTADGAALLAALIHAAADVLRATADWFTLLKQVRRALRITEGNPQDLYFQLCFELAATSGPPDPTTGRRTAEEALRETHGSAQGRTTGALKEYITDPAHTAELTVALERAWAGRLHGNSNSNTNGHGNGSRAPGEPESPQEQAALVRDVLDGCAAPSAGRSHTVNAPGGGRTADAGRSGAEALVRLVARHAGTAAGRALWAAAPAPGLPAGAEELGLTRHPVPVGPRLGGSAATAATGQGPGQGLGLPFDRTVYERVFSVLQTSNDRAGLAPVPELVHREIARSCAPWALSDESLRVAATVGVQLALGLRPLGGGDESGASASRSEGGGGSGSGGGSASGGGSGSGSPETDAHRVINSRWRREAYVLRARRLTVGLGEPGGSGERPGGSGESAVRAARTAQTTVPEPLARIAEDLRTPWHAYLRRLWVRLHGRDVREAPMPGVEELWDVLDGVARSVILDHRTRVRRALSDPAVPLAAPAAHPAREGTGREGTGHEGSGRERTGR